MKVYPPNTLTPQESLERTQRLEEQDQQATISDDTLREYINVFFDTYRTTLEQFFPEIAPYLALYAQFPYKTNILRLGDAGVFIGHTPASTADIQIMRLEDYDPPLETINFFDIVDRWNSIHSSFDFSMRVYDRNQAQEQAIGLALEDALHVFWHVIGPQGFDQLCVELLRAEEFELELEIRNDTGIVYDAKSNVTFEEPAGFRRIEEWAFEFKHFTEDRLSVNALREIETAIDKEENPPDVVCLLTSGDLTSFGKLVAVNNPRIRVWDRLILNQLVNKHLDTIARYFPAYLQAVERLSEQIQQATIDITSTENRLKEFEARLKSCPPGQQHFATYEDIGVEIWEYLFTPALGKGHKQRKTDDGSQRRDVLFPNKRALPFWSNVADDYNAKFIIVDFKNYTDPVDSTVIEDVRKYANKALGNFIIIVSRRGEDQTARRTQTRIFRDDDILVLVVSDELLLEMLARKERGEQPEDVLEDLLADFLMSY